MVASSVGVACEVQSYIQWDGRTDLSVLYTGETPNKIRHIDKQASKLLHMVGIDIHDLLNSIDACLQSAEGCFSASTHQYET